MNVPHLSLKLESAISWVSLIYVNDKKLLCSVFKAKIIHIVSVLIEPVPFRSRRLSSKFFFGILIGSFSARSTLGAILVRLKVWTLAKLSTHFNIINIKRYFVAIKIVEYHLSFWDVQMFSSLYILIKSNCQTYSKVNVLFWISQRVAIKNFIKSLEKTLFSNFLNPISSAETI